MGKSKKKITNWVEYNNALCKRGSITFWIDDTAIDAWGCKTHHGKRGRGFQYSDTVIETALMLKDIFSLPLRALQGFIDSIFELMDVPLTSNPSFKHVLYRTVDERTLAIQCLVCQFSRFD
ncbi:IS5/IS1182 family transposase [Vibrio breoganii]|nr:IS5/IS1182 family transposase [Vibrio breoganii]